MNPEPVDPSSVRRTSPVILILAWLGVGVPMLWGVLMTVKKAALLFK